MAAPLPTMTDRGIATIVVACPRHTASTNVGLNVGDRRRGSGLPRWRDFAAGSCRCRQGCRRFLLPQGLHPRLNDRGRRVSPATRRSRCRRPGRGGGFLRRARGAGPVCPEPEPALPPRGEPRRFCRERLRRSLAHPRVVPQGHVPRGPGRHDSRGFPPESKPTTHATWALDTVRGRASRPLGVGVILSVLLGAGRARSVRQQRKGPCSPISRPPPSPRRSARSPPAVRPAISRSAPGATSRPSSSTMAAWSSPAATSSPTVSANRSSRRADSQTRTFGDGGEPQPIRIGRLTPSVFAVLGTPPLAGRVFSEQDVATRTASTAILWDWLLAAPLRRRSRRPWPLDTSGPRHLHGGRDHADPLRLSVPRNRPVAARLHRTSFQRRWRRGLAANLRSDGSHAARRRPEQVAAEGTARARSGRDRGTVALAVFGSSEPPRISARPALDILMDDVRPAIRVQLAAVLLLFVTAIASVATLQLARAVKRRREMTVRVAIGGGTARLARQWPIEAPWSASPGGGWGGWGDAVAVRASSDPSGDFPRATRYARLARGARRDCGNAAAIVVGRLLPTIQSRRLDLVRSLADDGLGALGGAGRTGVARLRAAIMVGQIAVACVLLIGAGLLGRSFQSLLAVDRGYEPAEVLTARFSMGPDATFASQGATLQTIADRLQALPGVEHARSATRSRSSPPETSAGHSTAGSRSVDRHQSAGSASHGRAPAISPLCASLAGRPAVHRTQRGHVESGDGRQPVVRRPYWAQSNRPTRAPRVIWKAEWEVIGVVDNMKQGGLERAGLATMSDAAQPEMFSPYRQFDAMRLDSIFFVVRTAGDPAALAPTLRAVVREQAPYSWSIRCEPWRTACWRAWQSRVPTHSCWRASRHVRWRSRAWDSSEPLVQRSAAVARDWRPHGARRPNLGRGQVGAALGCDHHGGRTHTWARDGLVSLAS